MVTVRYSIWTASSVTLPEGIWNWTVDWLVSRVKFFGPVSFHSMNFQSLPLSSASMVTQSPAFTRAVVLSPLTVPPVPVMVNRVLGTAMSVTFLSTILKVRVGLCLLSVVRRMSLLSQLSNSPAGMPYFSALTVTVSPSM